MRWMCLDDQGNCVDESAVGLMRDLRRSMTDEQARDYLVVNLGFAAAGICDRYIAIRIRPAFVTGKAFAGLLYWLADQPEKRVIATLYMGERWQDEILGIGS